MQRKKYIMQFSTLNLRGGWKGGVVIKSLTYGMLRPPLEENLWAKTLHVHFQRENQIVLRYDEDRERT